MKLRIFSLFMAFSLFAASLFVGKMVELGIPTVKLITPDSNGYTRSINCSGEIIEQNREDVYLTLPVIASEVKHSVGDYVEKGEIIAVIDKAATATAIISSYTSGVNDMVYEAILDLPKDALAEALANFGSSVSLSETLKSIPNYIRAGISGTITSIDISCNKPTNAYKSIVTIIDDDTLVAKVSVGEENINSIVLGASATLSGSAFGHAQYEAKVTKIYPSAYKKHTALSSETVVDIILTPVSSAHELKSGYSTRANIVIDQVDTALTVPYEVVMQDEDNREYVYVYANGKAVKRYITTGLELSRGFEVLEGLDEDTLIVKNPNGISEGSYVRVIADED